MPATTTRNGRPSTIDVGVVKAIGHPLRMRLLERLNDRIASPVELARELDESVQLVSYHVRILRDLGFVELVSTTPRRGAIEHHYRAARPAAFSPNDRSLLPANARAALAGTALETMFADVAAAHHDGGLTDDAIATGQVVLDEQARGELNVLVGELLDHAGRLQAETAHRTAESLPESNDAERVRIDVLCYAVPAKPAKRRRKGAAKRA